MERIWVYNPNQVQVIEDKKIITIKTQLQHIKFLDEDNKRLEKEVKNLQEKLRVLNKDNEDNYNKYIERLKRELSLREEIDSLINQISKLSRDFNELERAYRNLKNKTEGVTPYKHPQYIIKGSSYKYEIKDFFLENGIVVSDKNLSKIWFKSTIGDTVIIHKDNSYSLVRDVFKGDDECNE